MDYVNKTLPEANLSRIALRKVVLEKKKALAKHVVGLASIPDRERVLGGLKPTLAEILKTLGLN